MLRLIRYEFLKLKNRYFVILTLVLFVLNALLCVYSVNKNSKIPTESLDGLMQLYKSEPETISDEYFHLKEWKAQQNILVLEQIRMGNIGYSAEKLQNKYAPDGFDDLELFDELFRRIDRVNSFPAYIQTVIDGAENNLATFRRMGISENSYNSKYQGHLIDTYKIVQSEADLRLDIVKGWNEFFSCYHVNAVIFIAILLASSVIVTNEKSVGVLPILRISRNGRGHIAFAKIVTMLCIVCIVMLIFIGETLIIIRGLCGLSSPAEAVQLLDNYLYCPFVITVGQLFWLSVLTKLIAYTLFSSVVMMISAVFYNYGIAFISGMGIYAANVLLDQLNLLDPDNPLRIMNLISTTNIEPIFSRLRSMNLFGKAVDYSIFAPIVYMLLYLICSVCFAVIFSLRKNKIVLNKQIGAVRYLSGVTSGLIGKFTNALNRRKADKSGIYGTNLLLWEIYKQFISYRRIWIIILLFALKVGAEYYRYNDVDSYADTVYREYMTKLAGEITDEKREYLSNERNYINSTLDSLPDIQYEYLNKTITLDEYEKYLSEYNYAYSHDELLAEIEARAAYIDRLAANGRNAGFVYDTGWKELFSGRFDISLYAAVLLLFADIFTVEYERRSSSGGFSQIMRLTKNGRKRIFRNKMIFTAAVSGMLSIIWNTAEFIIINNAYELPGLQLPAVSIEMLENIRTEMTVFQFAICFYAVKIAAWLILSCFICAMSAILKRTIPIITAVTLPTLFPSLLAYYRLEIFVKIDFTGFLCASPIMLSGSGGIAYMMTYAFISAAAAIYAERRWVE